MERNDEERRINRLAVLLMPNAYKRFKPIEWDKRYDPSSASDTHHDIDTRSGPRDHGIQGFQETFVRATGQEVVLVVAGCIFLVTVIAVAAFSYYRRNRLNWYEQNLLDMAEGRQAEYIRCKGRFHRDDTFEEPQSPTHRRHGSVLKQSRIVSITKPQDGQELLTAGAAAAIPEGDLSEIFTVPRSPMHKSSSMFRNPDQSQFDQSLYQHRQDSSASAEDPRHGQCGSLKLAIHYDANLCLLTVRLLQAHDLTAMRQDGPPNPYCRVTLSVPDVEGLHQTQQSRIYKNTRSPEMNDEFYFDVAMSQLNVSKLEVLFYDFDQFSVDECIGYCWLTIGRLDICTDSVAPTVFWAEVLPIQDADGEGYGEILFSLSYLTKAQRLTVNMFKARCLLIDESIEQPALAMRVTLLTSGEKRIKRKRTNARKNTCNPIFNESLTFTVPKNTLCETILEFEAVHEQGTFGMGTKVLGRLEVPLHTCKDLWRAIIRNEKYQARWYCLEAPP